MELAVEYQNRESAGRVSRTKNKPLTPAFLAKPPTGHPHVRWCINSAEKYDIKLDRHFLKCRKKGGAVPIGDGRFTYIQPRFRNIRRERELALYVIRKLCCSYVNFFPFEDKHVPLEVEISVKQMAKLGNMHREYDADYNGSGTYRHGREAMDIAYNAIKDLVLAGYAIPLTSHVEEGEKKGHYKPVRLFLTRDFFESMGVDFDELKRRQAKHREDLKEKGTWQKECRKQAIRLAKRLKKADLTQMTIPERERLLAQIERCRRYCTSNVLPLEQVRNKIKRQNMKSRKAGESSKDPESLGILLDKIAVFDPDMERSRSNQREIDSLTNEINLVIEKKAIPHPEIMKLERLAEEEVADLTEAICDTESRELRELEYRTVLLGLVSSWTMPRREPPKPPPS